MTKYFIVASNINYNTMHKYFYFIICSCIFYLIIFFLVDLLNDKLLMKIMVLLWNEHNISSFLYFSDDLL